MNVLISSAGRRVALLEAFRQEMAKLTSQGKVFAADMNPDFSAACHSSDKCFSVPHVRSPDYIDELLKICLNNHISLLIPTIDTELSVLSTNRQLFKHSGVNIAISDPSIIEIGEDKRLTHEFFLSRDISVAQEYEKTSLRYPCFVKPVNGSSSKDIYLLKDESYLFQRVIDDPDLMCLEYLNPHDHDEYTVDCYYSFDGIMKCAVPRLRLETRGGEVSKGRTVKNDLEQFVFDKLGHIDGARGCLTWQFFVRKSDQKVFGIELNPRFGGGYPLSYRAGANYPGWLIQEYLSGLNIPEFRNWEENLLMLRYDFDLFVPFGR